MANPSFIPHNAILLTQKSVNVLFNKNEAPNNEKVNEMVFSLFQEKFKSKHPGMPFIESIKSAFLKILNIGINEEQDAINKIYKQIVNMICVWAIIMPIYGSVMIHIHWDPSLMFGLIGTLITTILAGIGLYLNSINKFEITNYIILLVFPTIQFLITDPHAINPSGQEYTLVPLALVTPFLIRNKWVSFGIMAYILTLLGILTSARRIDIGYMEVINVILILTAGIVGIIAIINHLTAIAQQFKEYNIELKEKNAKQAELIIQNNLKTELLGILSHDLKGPAAAFNQLSKKVSFLLKKERYDELEEFGEYFEVAGDKIFHDIDRLLNWTIAQKENIIIRGSELKLYQLIQRICQSLNFQVKDKSVVFDNEIPKDCKLVTDGHLLEIILKNLLINAANNVENEETVSIVFSSNDTTISIHISNPGTPIDMSIVEQARAGRYRKSKKGHGLGLGICFSLIKFLKGQINFDSGVAQGTIATVILPVK